MQRTTATLLLSILLATASRSSLNAQELSGTRANPNAAPEPQATGVARATRPATPFDSAGVFVRVTSRELPFEMGDLMFSNCAWLASLTEPITYFVPWACVRRVTGTLQRLDRDTIAFHRGGRSIAISMRDLKKLERPGPRSAAYTVAGGVVGGLTGLVTAAILSVGGAVSDKNFGASAAVLTLSGAAIGGYRAGKGWTDWPRGGEPAPVRSP